MFFMILTSLIAVQPPQEMDGQLRREIYEAAQAGVQWAYWESTRLYPGVDIVQSGAARRDFLEREKEACRLELSYAAYRQICDAYHISHQAFRDVIENPRLAMSFPSRRNARTVDARLRHLPSWSRSGTRFQAGQVRLTEKLARRFGFENPRDPDKVKLSPLLEILEEHSAEKPREGKSGH